MNAAADRIKSAYLARYDKNPVFTLFLTALSVFMAIFIIAGIVTGGKSVLGMIFLDEGETFMDYFYSIMYSANDPYTNWHVIYPPLITLFYTVIGHFTIPFVGPTTEELLPYALRESQMGLMSYFFVTFITIYIFHLILSKLAAKREVRIRIELLFLLLVCSYPFLTAIERGNSILLAMVFCFIFLMGYRSENKWVRYASYISLGCAAGIKLYPALFGLLLLRERRWKDAVICAVISLAVLLGPFLLTDGNIVVLLENITSHVSNSSSFGHVNIVQIVNTVFQSLGSGIPFETTNMIGTAIMLAVMAMSFVVILFDRKMEFWKVVALIACNLIIGPGVGTSYIYVYIMIPVIYFLTSEREPTRENIFFMICFVLVVAVFAGFEFDGEWVTLALIKSGLVIAMTVYLIYEGLSRICRERIKQRPDAAPDRSS